MAYISLVRNTTFRLVIVSDCLDLAEPFVKYFRHIFKLLKNVEAKLVQSEEQEASNKIAGEYQLLQQQGGGLPLLFPPLHRAETD